MERFWSSMLNEITFIDIRRTTIVYTLSKNIKGTINGNASFPIKKFFKILKDLQDFHKVIVIQCRVVSNGLIKDIYKVEEDEKKHTDL